MRGEIDPVCVQACFSNGMTRVFTVQLPCINMETANSNQAASSPSPSGEVSDNVITMRAPIMENVDAANLRHIPESFVIESRSVCIFFQARMPSVIAELPKATVNSYVRQLNRKGE